MLIPTAPPVLVLEGQALPGGRLGVGAVEVRDDAQDVGRDLAHLGVADGADLLPVGGVDFPHAGLSLAEPAAAPLSDRAHATVTPESLAPHLLTAWRHARLAALHAENKPENAELPKKVSVNDFILSAVAHSLTRHPEVLRQFSVTQAGPQMLQLGNVDLGFAVSLEDGLITPVIRNADQYSLFQIAAAAQELSARARARKLKPEEYTGAGFTVSNLGMMGITSFQAIINAPESAILAVGATERRAYEGKNGAVEFGDFLTLNLACDHRVVDGAIGAAFLVTLTRYLENPGLIR